MRWALRVAVAAGLCLGLAGDGAPVWAQAEGTGQGPRYSDSVDIEAFGPPPDAARAPEVSDTLMVSIAYVIIWLLAVGFMWSIWRRSRALQSEIRSARRRLDALDKRLGEQLGSDPSGG